MASPPSWDGRRDAVANQAKAFEAIDQSILARQVGLPTVGVSRPTGRVEPIPLSFVKVEPSAPEGDGTSGGTARLAVGDDGQTESIILHDDDKTDPSVVVAEERTVSVSHVLTNTIILQSFLFELASLVQVRAGLFDEVRYA